MTHQRSHRRSARRAHTFLAACLLPLSLAACQKPSTIGPETETATEEPAHEDEPCFAAVWQVGAPETRIARAHELEDLEMPGATLIDVDVWLDDGQPHYGGLFLNGGDGANVVIEAANLGAFLAARAGQAFEDYCLVGFEVWRQQDETRYAGVLQPDCPKELFLTGLTPWDFEDKLAELAEDHLLIDFETVIVDKSLQVSALWHPGLGEDPAPQALIGYSWTNFHHLAHQKNLADFRQFDIDVQIENLEKDKDPQMPLTMISGVWRQGERDDWLGTNYHWEHLECAEEMLRKGHEESGLIEDVWTTKCDGQEEIQLETGGKEIRLVAFEGSQCIEEWRIHGGPLHDSGTAGWP